jgi:hypothetical protein
MHSNNFIELLGSTGEGPKALDPTRAEDLPPGTGEEDNRSCTTAVAPNLAADSLYWLAMLYGDDWQLRAWERLENSIRTGAST